jgi:hypothetical protein
MTQHISKSMFFFDFKSPFAKGVGNVKMNHAEA